MRPIYLKMQAFGPYVRAQEVFFSAFERSGIYLICGDTGAGKTSVLDGITYALYGKSSGGGRGKMEGMRCQFAPRELHTEVVFDFELRGRRYRFIRTVKQNRKNLQTTQDVLFEDNDGIFVPYFENPKLRDVEKKAEELIGLRYDQFCRVVMLPQGQFERLLVAGSEEKEEILTSLFGTERLQKAVEICYAKALEDLRGAEQKKQEIERVLLDWGCNSLQELEKQVKEGEKALCAGEVEELRLKKEMDAAKKKWEALAALQKQLDFLQQQKKAYARLLEKEAWAETEQNVLSAARKAAEIYPKYQRHQDSIKELEEAGRLEKQAARCWQEIAKQAEAEQRRRADFEGDAEARKAVCTRLLCLEGLTETYAEAEMAEQAAAAMEMAARKAAAAAEAAQNEEELKKKAKFAAEKERNELYKIHTELFEAYCAGISGKLAEELREGQPCPVCGSLYHPNPAEQKTDMVTDGDLAQLQDKIDDAAKLCRQREQECNAAGKVFANLQEEQQAAQKKWAEEKIRKDEIKKRLDPEIPDKQRLNEEISALRIQISAAEKQEKALQEAHERLQREMAAAETRAGEAEKRRAAAEQTEEERNKDFLEACLNAGFSDAGAFLKAWKPEETMHRIAADLSEYRAERKKTAETIAGLEESCRSFAIEDLDRQKKAASAAEAAYQTIHEAQLLRRAEQERLQKVFDALSEKQPMVFRTYDDCTEAIAFARKLRGDAGIGISRYMLGVLFGSVIQEANRLLTRVHGGRYQLYRTDTAAGRARKTGLELAVFDSLSGEQRPVAGLSGGEKFLVSLSLAIALSGVVRMRSGGVELQAMFIDEGFGSLDSSSVADALHVLSAMQGGGTVGIISHLPVLRENLTTGIRVIKEQQGSRLVCGTF